MAVYLKPAKCLKNPIKIYNLTLENLQTSVLIQSLWNVPAEDKWKCNNVEVTVFQLVFDNNDIKKRYRGLAVNRLNKFRLKYFNFSTY